MYKMYKMFKMYKIVNVLIEYHLMCDIYNLLRMYIAEVLELESDVETPCLFPCDAR